MLRGIKTGQLLRRGLKTSSQVRSLPILITIHESIIKMAPTATATNVVVPETPKSGFKAAVPKTLADGVIKPTKAVYGDWRDDFFRDGFVVLPGVLSADKTDYYRSKLLKWITGFNLGLDLEDESTWTSEHLPVSFKSMFGNYCAPHEAFMWEARCEPTVIEPFAKLYGTDELLVSFDSFNIGLPRRKDLSFQPWPHCDQSPDRVGLACVQGILNLYNSGPQDGGLIVMKGSAPLFEEFFQQLPKEKRFSSPHVHSDFYLFNEEQVKWFEDRGCTQYKVEAKPGDLILWDSRTMHHAAFPMGNEIRTVIYTCFAPASQCSPEDLVKKQQLFHRFEGTTHWPNCNMFGQGKAKKNGKRESSEICPLERDEPVEKPVVTEQVKKLAGLAPY